MAASASPASFALPRPAERTLQDQVALITGGACPLGAAIGLALGEAGMRVVLADVDFERVGNRAAMLSERDVRVMPLELDVSDAEQCGRAVERVCRVFGRLDVLVNNAVDDDWQRPLSLNHCTPWVLARYAAAVMSAQAQGGHIVNIASSPARRGQPAVSTCDATPWGLLGLSQAQHAALRLQGVRVCTLVAGGPREPLLPDGAGDLRRATPQNPLDMARAVRFVLQQPAGTSVPELLMLPAQKSSWP